MSSEISKLHELLCQKYNEYYVENDLLKEYPLNVVSIDGKVSYNSVDAILDDRQIVIIEGFPGSGKTTYCKSICYNYKYSLNDPDKNSHLILYLDLTNLENDNLADELNRLIFHSKINSSDLNRLLFHTVETLLIVDHFERLNQEKFPKIYSLIVNESTRFSKLIIVSRNSAINHFSTFDGIVRISGFSSKAVERFCWKEVKDHCSNHAYDSLISDKTLTNPRFLQRISKAVFKKKDLNINSMLEAATLYLKTEILNSTNVAVAEFNEAFDNIKAFALRDAIDRGMLQLLPKFIPYDVEYIKEKLLLAAVQSELITITWRKALSRSWVPVYEFSCLLFQQYLCSLKLVEIFNEKKNLKNDGSIQWITPATLYNSRNWDRNVLSFMLQTNSEILNRPFVYKTDFLFATKFFGHKIPLRKFCECDFGENIIKSFYVIEMHTEFGCCRILLDEKHLIDISSRAGYTEHVDNFTYVPREGKLEISILF